MFFSHRIAINRRCSIGASLAWRCRLEIQFCRLGVLLAFESEHCGPREEFRKTFTTIGSRSTTLEKPLIAVVPSFS
jgi:hypothetical protein